MYYCADVLTGFLAYKFVCLLLGFFPLIVMMKSLPKRGADMSKMFHTGFLVSLFLIGLFYRLEDTNESKVARNLVWWFVLAMAVVPKEKAWNEVTSYKPHWSTYAWWVLITIDLVFKVFWYKKYQKTCLYETNSSV